MDDVKRKRMPVDPTLYPVGSIESRAAARALAEEREKNDRDKWVTWTFAHIDGSRPSVTYRTLRGAPTR